MVYIIKTVVLLFVRWFQADFVYRIYGSLSQRLFESYAVQPYIYHLEKNTSKLLRNTSSEVGAFIVAVSAFTEIVSEMLMIIAISAIIFYLEPVGLTASIFFFSTIGYLFYKFTKNLTKSIGEKRLFYEGERIQTLQESLGSIKDIKIRNIEKFFFKKYQKNVIEVCDSATKQQFLMGSPRIVIEFLAVLIFVLFIFILIEKNVQMSSVIPLLGVLVASAFKILPSVNRIIIGVQKLRYATPVVNLIYSELVSTDNENNNISKQKKETNNKFEKDLVLKDISFSYPKGGESLFNSLSVSIKKNTMIGIMGDSGVGKTTLINIILGLIKPSSGSILLDGYDIKNNIRVLQDKIGYVPQSIYLADCSVIKNIAFGIDEAEIDFNKVIRSSKDAKLHDFINQLPDGYNTVVGERGAKLSGGQIQRIGIARVLYNNPEIIIFDESTSSLDFETEEAIISSINEFKENKTIIMISHKKSSLRFCEKIYSLNNRLLEVIN